MSGTYRHKSDCATTGWPIAGVCDCGALRDRLRDALEAIGGSEDGACFCFGHGQSASKPETEHTVECREARAALDAFRNAT